MSDLFNNPMINAAKQNMTPEQLEHFKKLGESMYENIDFENNEVNNMPPPMVEALAYVCESIKSGLHPSFLEENEIALLKDAYGEKWYERWNFTEEDLKKID